MASSDAAWRLLYFSPAAAGGLADYAREQANALARLGVQVDLLSSSKFVVHPGDAFHLLPELPVPMETGFRLFRRLNRLREIPRSYATLVRIIGAGRYRHVLLGSYAEYLAPLWSGKLERLARNGVIFGAVIHDPVRDYIVGPHWWHRWSIARAYSFLREAFVHEPMVLDTIRPMPRLRTTVIPHGIYAFPPAALTREACRRQLEIPADAEVWLSFGHIRDGKNLDLVIRALAEFPGAFLLVAGKEQSSGQKPVAFYRELAERCGVASRCRWVNRFVPADEVGAFFEASDLVLLTYSRDFRSASGVLNAAVHFRKPCLASSGPGNLQTVIARYDLGIWVEPDDVETLVSGLKSWRSAPPSPRWDAYEADNSWRLNAEMVLRQMFGGAE